VSPARRARGAVMAIFLLNGFVYGSWAARIPAVRDRLGLSDGELGLALACIPIGSIIAMPVAGALAARAGSRRATRLAFAVMCVITAVVALAPSLVALGAVLLVFGMGMGSLDVAMNVHGVTVEREYGRPIFSGFHAAFSFGGLAGGALGSLAAHADLDVRAHLVFVGLLCAAVGLTWSRRFLPGSADAVGEHDPIFVKPPRKVWALGALAFACLLIEGASADWSGVYIKDELGASAAFAALGFTAFSVTMTLGRVFGDGLVGRLGSVRLVRAGGIVAAVGFGAALVVAAPPAALVGFACLGAGMSSVIPIVFRAAGHVPGIASSVSLSAVSSIGYLGFVAGPPAIGGIAELIGLPNSLAVIVLLAALVAVLARTTAPAAVAATEEREAVAA
jgi:MFS family permease